MKPEEEILPIENEEPVPVTGDVIGDTAYSERFVLKILLKFANLDTLKEEINEKSFEDELCILWDMTSERDVVLFLQKHDALNLFFFSLPVIEIPRIIEIIVGIIANMCCQQEVVSVLMKMEGLLDILINYVSNNDDSLVLVQLMRLISGCLFVAHVDEVSTWMELFSKVEYSTSLYFILKNSAHKELLTTTLENLNTVCSYCNTEQFQSKFVTHFVTPNALESVTAAVCEITNKNEDSFGKQELERVFVISLQIILNLLSFDKSEEIYNESTEDTLNMINIILVYFESKLNLKEMDADLFDIVDSITTIVKVLPVDDTCEPSTYFEPTYSMWKTINSILKSAQNDSSFDNSFKAEVEEFSEKMKPLLSGLTCNYLTKCSNDNLLQVLDAIGEDYEAILSLLKDKDVQVTVQSRTSSYRSRLEENVDSK